MSITDKEKILSEQLDKARQKLLELERTARWWNDSCVSWREKWAIENSEKNRTLEEMRMLNGRNMALITEFQRIQAENESLKSSIKDQHRNEDEEAKQVARVEPIIEEIKTAKTMIIVSPISSQNPSLNSSESINNDIPLGSRSTQVDVCYSINDSYPRLKEELEGLKHLIENLESNSSGFDGSPGDEEKHSFFTNLVGRVEGYFMECDQFVQETHKEIENATRQYVKNTHKKNKVNQQNQAVEYTDIGIQTDRCSESLTIINELDLSSLSIDDGQCTSVELVVQDLRQSLHRLQEENCKEWSLREQCEKELFSVKRELRNAVDKIKEFEEAASKSEKNIHEANCLKLLNEELDKKTKELLELKLLYGKTKKSLENRVLEVAHEKTRTEQYENEMKKLRSKVEQLRKDLLETEEKNDIQMNQIRRLQRNSDEQKQLNESLKLQINQNSTRFKYQNK